MTQEITHKELDLTIKARLLAEHLFQEYIKTVCKHIGFDATDIDICMGLRYNKEGENWHEAENLKIEVSARICEAFRKAYIEIGVSEKVLKPV